ncbi:hypothetical protein ACP4OV_031066 [Aristida adscensionis]
MGRMALGDEGQSALRPVQLHYIYSSTTFASLQLSGLAGGGGRGACALSLLEVRERSIASLVRMRSLKRKRVEAPRVPTLEDVHASTLWSMSVKIYHKFHVERFATGQKRLSMVLLDQRGKKMAAIIYDDEVVRFEPSLVEGHAYYVWRMAAEPVMTYREYRLADSHFVCRFTSATVVNELRNVSEQLLPLFPPFMPFGRVWEFTFDNDTYIDVIGMVLYVSSIGSKDGFYNRKIPLRKILLMDGSLHTTEFSRLYFDPDIAVARGLRRRINNELSGEQAP